MRITKVSQTKMKIILDDDEVYLFFGSYSRLELMDEEMQLAMNFLLSEAFPEDDFLKDKSKVMVDLTARAGIGCEIILTKLSRPKRLSRPAIKACLLEFGSCENMLSAAVFLYKSKKYKTLKSSLYKMYDSYRLLLIGEDINGIKELMGDFYARFSTRKAELAYTLEYGSILAGSRAIETIGRAFKHP